ncbi:hypothetical protein BDV96DRAFT_593954 [Lophiotrema nucula]|uniref:BTB domain-containing protein n=1 Tax=Lophiotrema nucula TaxID=690887 RepID=A0A6A5ZSP2_9PLEO|nr:hypothetical protein BDV96DRAFT_593954 [Lophiotrema nucula]
MGKIQEVQHGRSCDALAEFFPADDPSSPNTNKTSILFLAPTDSKASEPKKSRGNNNVPSSRTVGSNANTSSRLLKIPSELRNRIFKFALTYDDPLVCRIDGTEVQCSKLCRNLAKAIEPSIKSMTPEEAAKVLPIRMKLTYNASCCPKLYPSDNDEDEANQLKYVCRQLYQETRGLELELNTIVFVSPKDDWDLDLAIPCGCFLLGISNAAKRRISKIVFLYKLPEDTEEKQEKRKKKNKARNEKRKQKKKDAKDKTETLEQQPVPVQQESYANNSGEPRVSDAARDILRPEDLPRHIEKAMTEAHWKIVADFCRNHPSATVYDYHCLTEYSVAKILGFGLYWQMRFRGDVTDKCHEFYRARLIEWWPKTDFLSPEVGMFRNIPNFRMFLNGEFKEDEFRAACLSEKTLQDNRFVGLLVQDEEGVDTWVKEIKEWFVGGQVIRAPGSKQKHRQHPVVRTALFDFIDTINGYQGHVTSSLFCDTPIIKVIVGSEKKELSVYERLIVQRSKFFANALRGDRWTEAQEKTVTLPEDDPVIVGAYIEFIFPGAKLVLPSMAFKDVCVLGTEKSVACIQENLVYLCDLYVLARKLMDEKTSELLLGEMKRTARRDAPPLTAITTIYDGTTTGDPARAIIVEAFQKFGNSEDINWDYEHGPPVDFLQELSANLMKSNRELEKKNLIARKRSTIDLTEDEKENPAPRPLNILQQPRMSAWAAPGVPVPNSSSGPGTSSAFSSFLAGLPLLNLGPTNGTASNTPANSTPGSRNNPLGGARRNVLLTATSSTAASNTPANSTTASRKKTPGSARRSIHRAGGGHDVDTTPIPLAAARLNLRTNATSDSSLRRSGLRPRTAVGDASTATTAGATAPAPLPASLGVRKRRREE